MDKWTEKKDNQNKNKWTLRKYRDSKVTCNSKKLCADEGDESRFT